MKVKGTQGKEKKVVEVSANEEGTTQSHLPTSISNKRGKSHPVQAPKAAFTCKQISGHGTAPNATITSAGIAQESR